MMQSLLRSSPLLTFEAWGSTLRNPLVIITDYYVGVVPVSGHRTKRQAHQARQAGRTGSWLPVLRSCRTRSRPESPYPFRTRGGITRTELAISATSEVLLS